MFKRLEQLVNNLWNSDPGITARKWVYEMANKRERVLIMGAAGRDFHNFNMYFRDNPQYEVVGFTAAQIPDILDRKYPLAGKLYKEGVPIFDEKDLYSLIKEHNIDTVVFSYSDVSYNYLGNRSAIANSAGANFMLLGPNDTMLKSKKPVISVTASRTGCGKSQTSRKICDELLKRGYKVAAIRHPMPYGDLVKQEVQRFATRQDMIDAECTIEEMEEYEPYTSRSMVVFAGVDYGKILKQAEKEADIIIWDGGNNDFSFIRPDLSITVVDPLRVGDESSYYPGEVNVRMADYIIINKIDTASKENVDILQQNVRALNDTAQIIMAESPMVLQDPETGNYFTEDDARKMLKGLKVLAVEDGPTTTHGGAKTGAGMEAAKRYGVKSFVDPNKDDYLVGELKETFRHYPNISTLLPAMGYSEQQIKDLHATINNVPCDMVVIGTPIDLSRLFKERGLEINKNHVRVEYNLNEVGDVTLSKVLDKFIGDYL